MQCSATVLQNLGIQDVSRPSSAVTRQADQAAELTQKSDELSQKDVGTLMGDGERYGEENGAFGMKRVQAALFAKEEALSQKDAELQAKAQAEQEALEALQAKDAELERAPVVLSLGALQKRGRKSAYRHMRSEASEKEEMWTLGCVELERMSADKHPKPRTLHVTVIAVRRTEEVKEVRGIYRNLQVPLPCNNLQSVATVMDLFASRKNLTELRAQHKEPGMPRTRPKHVPSYGGVRVLGAAQMQLQEREVELEGQLKEKDLEETSFKTGNDEEQFCYAWGGDLTLLQAQRSPCVQELTIQKLEEDTEQLTGQVTELSGVRERAEQAEQMLEPWKKRTEEIHEAFQKDAHRSELARSCRCLDSLSSQEQALRKRYHNQMQDMKGAIRVFARIRPKVSREADQEISVWRRDAFSLECAAKDKKSTAKDYNFDAVFDEHNTQEDVFADCRGLIGSAVDGFNVTVFAYGQTGAGKYGNEAISSEGTCAADPKAGGVGRGFTWKEDAKFLVTLVPARTVPSDLKELFAVLSAVLGVHRAYLHIAGCQASASLLQRLYRDDLVDLLFTKGKGKVPPVLDIKKDPRGTVKVENAVEIEVTSPEELQKTIAMGMDRRHVVSDTLKSFLRPETDEKTNEHTRLEQRSHLIFIVTIESLNKKSKQVSTGKLTLCDLAGSERLKKSEVTGEQMKEAQSINKSLTALGDVIEALTKQAKHVPYRNHRLTQLLSDSLGGNAKTLMFVNCSPASGNLDETAPRLAYAVRAKNIVNKVEKNSDSQEVARLKKAGGSEAPRLKRPLPAQECHKHQHLRVIPG
ncbi:KIN14E [Symbiodinium natans]|uniref:Kinesin-like protein n=1 Tax=Symbiodinium natans TaxID=878477 RepID=A0A812TL45_9DINO|nr:KIN14E [Symbiodinium natans]